MNATTNMSEAMSKAMAKQAKREALEAKREAKRMSLLTALQAVLVASGEYVEPLTSEAPAGEPLTIVETAMLDFQAPAVRYIGKSEVLTSGIEDVYVKIAVHTVQGEIAVLVNGGEWASRLVTRAQDRIIMKITRLAYGMSEAQQASALKGYRRVSEAQDVIYAAVYRGEDGKLRTDAFLSFDRKEKRFTLEKNFAGEPMTSEDREHFTKLCNSHLLRVSKNEQMRDARYTTIKGKRTAIGMFAMLKEQNSTK